MIVLKRGGVGVRIVVLVMVSGIVIRWVGSR